MEQSRNLLIQGLSALNLPYTERQLQQLLQFLQLMSKWNKVYNLTAITDPQKMVSAHLLDSLAILPYVKGQRLIDIGTGGGLPGIPLAIFCPQYEWVLLDSNAKKTRFVQQVILELQLTPIEIQQQRVENYRPQRLFNQIISRAFADTGMMLKLTQHLLADKGQWLAMKSQVSTQELAGLPLKSQLIPLSVPQIEARRCLLCIEKSEF
jgi:16S rRNA (guanine527-N7)-methyltransferase